MTHEEALKPLDSAIWEMGEAFGGLGDGEVWARAHPRLLSVGELAAHVAFGEARWILGSFDSPLATEKASYYPDSVEAPLSLNMGAEALYAEVQRVHSACRTFILETRPDLDGASPYRSDWTWGGTLEYMAFHIAYHTGQMYSVRHLLGHETPDN